MDKYIQIRKIGEGSFGKALLVKRKGDGKQCVVKQIGISRMSSKEREESRKEVQLLSKLKHPNIVSYMESFEGSGNLYIVMDYCEGGDLYQLIVKQRGIHMDEAKVLDMFVQCCLAIKYIHDRKILHRDIKTQNIFLTKHHIVKLGDFGIARVLKNTMELARTCIGTPYYLSPEIVENRPYNNKSDIWSLGCVLYELATLKHAFEAGNMKNLVLKICRGSYPPVPNKYSFELRSLVAHCFKRSPSERPSINTLLKKPIIQQRISKFLSPEEVQEEFSHTVLHRVPKVNPVDRAAAGLPQKVPAGKRKNDLVSVYGVSVAKKPVVRKPLAAVNPVVRPKSSSGQSGKNAEKRVVDARERRRKEILSQEQNYHAHIKKIQKQRYEKQQVAHIKRAREEGWKNILGTDEKDKMKKYQPKMEDKVIVNNKQHVQPEEKPKEQQQKVQPVKPLHAWSKEEQKVQKEELRNDRKSSKESEEKARMLEEFWQRKKEAAANKARAAEALAAPNPILRMHDERMKRENVQIHKPPIHPGARNPQEAEYLRQLEQIRRQNYNERKAMKGGGVQEVKYEAQPENRPGVGDPRFDADARRRKIQALKEQADRRAAMLKEQLERRRKHVQERVERDRIERMQKWKEERESFPHIPQQQQQQQQIWNQEKPIEVKKEIIKPKDFAVPSVGMATAMNQVAQPKLFRSLSEGEIQNLVKKRPKEDGVKRKVWGGNPQEPFAFANIPLEITASAMEATRVIDTSPVKKEEAAHRKGWNEQGKTQFVSMLHNMDLIGTQMPTTMTIKKEEKEACDKTIVVSKQKSGPSGSIGETIVISKNTVPKTNVGETITISGKPKTKNIPVISQDVNKTIVISSDKSLDKNNENVSPTQTDRTEEQEKRLDNKDEKQDEELEVIELKSDESTGKQNNEKDNTVKDITVKDAWTDKDSPAKSPRSKASPRKENKTPEKQEKKEVEASNPVVKNENDSSEDEEDEQSFHTPNRTFGLQSGSYDVVKKEVSKLLRTCSLPDLRPSTLVEEDENDENEAVSQSVDSNEASETKDDKNEDEIGDSEKVNGKGDSDDKEEDNEETEGDNAVDENDIGDEEGEEDSDEDEGDEDGEQGEKEGENEGEEDGEGDDNIDDEEDEEEIEDYESMLESMRNVLGKTSNPSSAEATLKDNEEMKNKEEVEIDDDEWEEEEEDDTGNPLTATMKEKAKTLKDDRENLFSRIEESRKALEDELGMDLFIKVYRHVQMMQDNEDDALEVGTTEISELLGDKENLYQKVLYLVIADSAYSEGNDGTF